ncbi:MAG: glycolate oxidase subunit GlcD [Nitrospirae bacterium CG_4_10_14_0_8_um_filter_41_23]|nr:FAD-binding protein [Nitrospirota bacterium]OIP61365.1 MAG: glycolate oxidase subunit GlcD [Nitrospirae bacterium CG2_30_41_42]PIQ94575.1 MAG: glycolate oxidase subunit GlcD [Nitrospirae bacterium CG11_big_fil_rev_8_21_14_0_20_41_14]PIV41312.1 MAG: glycolate oxidase subunit GlcD [Nitrospirae bacterium CG02_land_8_20_14_3_00_41_53]PIW87699.1 MAG: glycolate oxidase subunit GlcD [Nitrospirae bacterium CG_4_8_14_3_um_filter_41_47]PIY86541.1 MAG: glycolate oxidase subunit GlcD [Nitrospirae bacte
MSVHKFAANTISDRLPSIKISTEPEDLVCYGFDASGIEASPSAVVWPNNTEDVVKVMRYAYENSIPVVPRGAGTGMTAGAVPAKGAMIISFEKMNRILEIDSENLNVLCEPGLINGKLQRELKWMDLFYPPDPASMNFCTIGGNVAENAGGPRALKYGVTRDYVMEIEAVLPNGEIITTGVKTSKGVVGYDLARLLVGSEGTLSVFTKIRLKVIPMPEEVVTLLAAFDNLESSGVAVSKIISAKIIPRTLEFMDREAIIAVENYKPIGLPEGVEAILLIELDGHPATITKEAEKIADICRNLGAEIEMAEDENARDNLWAARRAISPALYHIKPTKINEDIVIPRNMVSEMLKRLRKLSEDSGIKIVNFGHAGDGNIHVNIMVDRKDKEEYQKGLSLVEQIFKDTLSLGGTISGEHGIGLTKAGYIGMEISKKELEIMEAIKKVFDPKNILNPGKIFPLS